MRIQNQDKEQLQIHVHGEEASHLLTDLKAHAELLDGEADDLIEALEAAGVQPFTYPEHYRMEFPQQWNRVERDQEEDLTLPRQEVLGM
jgi:hypothetical protein